MSKAVVLLSGGLDSATTAALAKDEGQRLYALTISYGQRHDIELEAAAKIADWLEVEDHRVVEFIPELTGSALTSKEPLPPSTTGIPPTYVPARNAVFLAHAFSYAESVGASTIWIGVNVIDYSGYPDCRRGFLQAFQRAMELGTKVGAETNPIKIHAPLIYKTKDEIISMARNLGVPLALTHSCYDPQSDGACGRCDSCLIRLRGFAAAGVTDPVAYA
jgi:7-cyano-7-deazaguanine synthase